VTVRTLDNFIGGTWTPSAGDTVREFVSPVTGEAIAEAPDASSEDIDRGGTCGS
jgi:acyl-CoA reductase-like NAD-dependent aldehyde dehydrogenase